MQQRIPSALNKQRMQPACVFGVAHATKVRSVTLMNFILEALSPASSCMRLRRTAGVLVQGHSHPEHMARQRKLGGALHRGVLW